MILKANERFKPYCIRKCWGALSRYSHSKRTSAQARRRWQVSSSRANGVLIKNSCLFKKRRQFQERIPNSPCQGNADDEPIDKKLAPVSGRLRLVSHNVLS